jgi:hypothetical protein
MLAFAVIMDAFEPGRKWFNISRGIAFGAMTIMFVSLLVPAMPNYLAHTDFSGICPYCAKNFNNFVQAIVGDLVGLIVSAVFTFNFIIVLLAVAPGFYSFYYL